MANATDLDGDSLTITNITQGNNGVVQTSNNQIIYTPNQNFNGTDTFTYTISDGNGGQITKSITVSVNPINDAPVAITNSATVNEDAAVTINVLEDATDIDGDSLTIAKITQGNNGVVQISNNQIIYIPNQNFNGTDTFTYIISDGNGGQVTKSITVSVNPINDIPVAITNSATVNEDATVTIDVLANATDLDGDSLTITNITQGNNGVVQIINDQLKYTPNTNFNGTDTFTYTISDGNGGITTKSITVDVHSVNDAPIVTLNTATLNEDSSIELDVLKDAIDDDGDTLTIHSITQSKNGFVQISNGKIKYTPNINYYGVDSFDYTINDSNGGLVTKTMTIQVSGIKDEIRAKKSLKHAVVNGDSSTIFKLPEDAIIDVDNDATYTITLKSGKPLPNWMIFNPLTMSIECKKNKKIVAGKYAIKITAKNDISETTTTFKIMIASHGGSDGEDHVKGEDGNHDEILYGGAGKDKIYGGQGADVLDGGEGDDTLYFEADSQFSEKIASLNAYSRDFIKLTDMNETTDVFIGGDGTDAIYLSHSSDALFLDNGISDAAIDGERISEIEEIYCGDGNDLVDFTSFTMTYEDVTVYGEAGNDVLWTNDGNDTLVGGEGNDNLQGGAGDDTHYGDAGNDIIKGYTGNDTIIGGAGSDTMTGGDDSDVFTFEALSDSTL